MPRNYIVLKPTYFFLYNLKHYFKMMIYILLNMHAHVFRFIHKNKSTNVIEKNISMTLAIKFIIFPKD